MLEPVIEALRQRPEVAAARSRFAAGERLRLEGLAGSHCAALLAELQAASGRPLALAVPAELDVETTLLDLRAFHAAAGGEGRVVAYPRLAIDPYGKVPPHDDVVRERLQTLDRCVRGRVAMLLAPVNCWRERLRPPAAFTAHSLSLGVGSEIDPEKLALHLTDAGYRRVSLVESLGEFAVRGGIVDLFPPTREHPVRLEFFGDEVDALREFNPRDQRSMRQVESVVLPPATPQALSAEAAEAEGAGATLADYLDEAGWVEVEPDLLEAEAEGWDKELDEHYHDALTRGEDPALPERLYAPLEAALRRDTDDVARATVHELAGAATDAGVLRLGAQPAPSYRGRLADLAGALQEALREGERVCLAMSQPGKAERLAEILEGYDVPVALHATPRDRGPAEFAGTDPGAAAALPAGSPGVSRGNSPDPASAPPVGAEGPEGGEGIPQARPALDADAVRVVVADLSAGFRVPEVGLWLGTDEEVFGRARPRARSRRFHGDAFQADFRDLSPGDLVVHVEHGVGRFVGVKTLEVAGERREFMEIGYAGQDRLYLPLDQLYLVQRFRGGEDARPRLDKLGGASWSKVKSRVKKELRELASELLELYAHRKAAEGRTFGPDTPWQRELEDSFEYRETPDQLAAIADIKADMESPKPMDRLLCGDVGYGKTEVAIRAAFKAVMDGAQVAVLAPTTVLAHQHWRTFRERMAAFPVRIELLSRFRSAAEQRQVVADLEDGSVDVVVATHRLLSRDVGFRDLGLLIIDEEQRFGVQQKERLKLLKKEVDVLSMTATPIPRTLQMSLVGVRDLSVIETPPQDRYSIATHIVPFDRDIVTGALREELGRGGQAFFVHNRVESIYRVADMLRQLVPEARFRVGHGQLPKQELERVMLDFVEHEADVLVTTTIIENGLDIPLANTIVVNRADRFGLAQLYQLRGRVGRSDRRAYAYLVVPPVEALSEVAKKRLRAIQEFSDLGSGFRLAAMDLEIRGAGSLLGEKQHGHIAAVGFDMYARLLEEAVHELQGEPAPAETRAQLNLGIDLQLPIDYIEDPIQRLMVSKKLASARHEAQLEDLQEELRDRFGPLPPAAEVQFAYARLRLRAEAVGIVGIERQGGDRVAIRFTDSPQLDTEALTRRVQKDDDWELKPPGRLVVRTGSVAPGRLLDALEDVVDALAAAPSAQGR